MTVIGPLPCIACRTPVTVVRRAVALPCSDCRSWGCSKAHHVHEVPGIGPMTVVDKDGARHECRKVAAA